VVLTSPSGISNAVFVSYQVPTIAAPPALTVSSDPGACFASNVLLLEAELSSDCSGFQVSNNAPETFPVGNTEVTWTVTDVNGNTNTAVQNVTVSDNEAPIAICSNASLVLDANGEAFINTSVLDGGSFDNCGDVTLSLSQDTFGVEDLGIVMVTLTATDASGNFSTCIAEVSIGPFTEGDNACTALTINCGESLNGTTLGASVDNAPFCNVTNTAGGVWYKFTAETDENYILDLCGSAFDTKLSVYEGSCGGLVCVAGNDDDPRLEFSCGLQSYLEISATAGTEYYVLVHGFGFAEGAYTLSLTCPCIIDGGVISTTDPTSICVNTGSPTFLDVTLTGAVGDNGIWGVTNDVDFEIIATAFNGPNFNWDNFAPGNYRLWRLSYNNDVSIAGVTNGLDLTGCFEYSNPINVTCAIVDGGIISTTSPTSICVGEGVPKSVNATVVGAVGPQMGWGLLDFDFNVLQVRLNNSLFNLDALAPGTYRLYHASFARTSDVAGLTNISEITGCVENSNGIIINAQACPAAAVLASQPNPTSGPSSVSFSLGTASWASLEVYDLSGRLIKSIFNANAEAGFEYRFDFDATSLPNGIYLYRLNTESEVLIDKFIRAH
jgi:hypothetical protein